MQNKTAAGDAHGTGRGTAYRSGRGAGRPLAPVLSRRTIVETALRLLDSHGAEGFGMRDLARALGVRVSSLYNHVSGKDDVYAGMRELVAERINAALPNGGPWEDALIAWAYAYREAFAAHPSTVALLAALPMDDGSAVMIGYDDIVGRLIAEGWEPARALDILVALESFILGSALDAAAPPDMLDPGPRTDVPAFSGAYAARSKAVEAAGTSPADRAFSAGLEVFLAGLRAELD